MQFTITVDTTSEEDVRAAIDLLALSIGMKTEEAVAKEAEAEERTEEPKKETAAQKKKRLAAEKKAAEEAEKAAAEAEEEESEEDEKSDDDDDLFGDDDDGETFTREQVKARLKEYSAIEGRDAVVTLLNKYGDGTMSGLEEANFAKVMKEAKV